MFHVARLAKAHFKYQRNDRARTTSHQIQKLLTTYFRITW